MSFNYVLTDEEMETAERVGKERNANAEKEGRKHRLEYLPGESPEENHILACYGETAVAGYLGVPWDGTLDTYKTAPDQSGCEVRTRRKWYYELYIRDGEDPNQPFILVTQISDREYTVRGWEWGYNIRSNGRRTDFSGRGEIVSALYNRHLRPLEDLKELIFELA